MKDINRKKNTTLDKNLDEGYLVGRDKNKKN